jgi:hypothetical protein
MAHYDLEIDHRIVSVVQLGDTDVTPAADVPALPTRPALSSITVRSTLNDVEVLVSLTTGNELFEGKAGGPAGRVQRARVVARATLEAATDLLGRPCEVESAGVVEVGQRQVAVCVLTLVDGRAGEHVLTGCAVVRNDEAEAVAKAVLDALNRQLAG